MFSLKIYLSFGGCSLVFFVILVRFSLLIVSVDLFFCHFTFNRVPSYILFDSYMESIKPLTIDLTLTTISTVNHFVSKLVFW